MIACSCTCVGCPTFFTSFWRMVAFVKLESVRVPSERICWSDCASRRLKWLCRAGPACWMYLGDAAEGMDKISYAGYRFRPGYSLGDLALSHIPTELS